MKYASLCEMLSVAEKLSVGQASVSAEPVQDKTYKDDDYVSDSSRKPEQVARRIIPEDTESSQQPVKPVQVQYVFPPAFDFTKMPDPLTVFASPPAPSGLTQEDIQKMLNTVDGIRNKSKEVNAELRKIQEITRDAISDIDKLKKKYDPG